LPKPPRKPREIKRGTHAKRERVIAIHRNLRQAGLFDLPRHKSRLP
jgi:hypothetical protein